MQSIYNITQFNVINDLWTESEFVWIQLQLCKIVQLWNWLNDLLLENFEVMKVFKSIRWLNQHNFSLKFTHFYLCMININKQFWCCFSYFCDIRFDRFNIIPTNITNDVISSWRSLWRFYVFLWHQCINYDGIEFSTSNIFNLIP